MLNKKLMMLITGIALCGSLLVAQTNRDEVIQITYPLHGTVVDTDSVVVTFTLAPYFTIGDSGCTDCDGYLVSTLNGIPAATVHQTGAFVLRGLTDGMYFQVLEAVDPAGSSFDPAIFDTASFQVAFEENYCPPTDLFVSSEYAYESLSLFWRAPVGGGGGGAFFEDFELDDGGFTGEGDWEWGVPTAPDGPGAAYSGSMVWGTVLAGDFTNGACDMLKTPPVFIVGIAPQLRFWHWYDFGTGNFDAGNVKISVDGGTTFTIIEPVGGYNATAGTGTCAGGEIAYDAGVGMSWQQAVFDLTPYIGQEVILAWHLLSTTVVTHSGWYVDDVEIGEAPVTRISERTGREIIPTCGDLLRYDIYRDNTFLASADTTFFGDTVVVVGSQYCYFVQAVYLDGSTEVLSANTDTVCGIPEVFTPPAVTNLSGVPLDEQVYLSWTPPGTPTYVFFEDFSNGIPASWTVVDGGSTNDTWSSPHANSNAVFSGFGDNLYAICDSDDAGSGGVVMDEQLITPVLNFTNITTPFLQFKTYYNDISATDTLEFARVDISIDGGTSWTNLLNWSEDHGTAASPEIAVVDLAVAGGQENVKLRFHYADNARWAWYWAIDDITVLDAAPTLRTGEGEFVFYRVYEGTTLVGDSVLTTNYLATGLTNGQSYDFGVTAVYHPSYESVPVTVAVTPIWMYGDITGVVSDPNGTPLDSAVVALGSLTDTTGSDGVYFLHNLEPGVHTVRVGRAGFDNDQADVTVVAQEAASVQNFTLIPKVLRPTGLVAAGGDSVVYLQWNVPGSEDQYPLAYFDDVFESQIGCGGGCMFGVRYTPLDYPATLLFVDVWTQGDASVANGNLVAYLDPAGTAAGPAALTGITLATGLNLASDAGNLTHYLIDVSDAGLEITSGDVYLIIEEASSGWMGIANDIAPQSPEFYDRNWVFASSTWSTIYDAVGGDPTLVGDFGMMATLFGGMSGRLVTIDNRNAIVDIVPGTPGAYTGILSSSNQDGNLEQVDSKVDDSHPLVTFIENPVSARPYHTRDTNPPDSLVGYRIYEVVSTGDTLVAEIQGEITAATIQVPANYVEYCYYVKATWYTNTYGLLDSKPSNTACATPFLPGDVNLDDVVNLLDLLEVVDYALGVATPTEAQFRYADMNRDRVINIVDIIMIVDVIVGPGLGRELATDPGVEARVDMRLDPSGNLGLAVHYDGFIRGTQFRLQYHPGTIRLGAPQLVNLSAGIVLASHTPAPGILDLIVVNVDGGLVDHSGSELVSIPVTPKAGPAQPSQLELNEALLVDHRGLVIPLEKQTLTFDIRPLPERYALHQNYPNPFNPVTEIRFDMPVSGKATLTIYNLQGQKVRTLVNTELEGGYHTITWDGRNDQHAPVATGVYIYNLTSRDFQSTKKMVLLK